jgi:hypothetical protein
MNDHDDVLEQLEIATVQPGGLDRLIAGDTAEASSVAGHLAGCTACMDEFARLRRTGVLVRDAVASQPPPELRARTLALVAAVGRPPASLDAVAVVAQPADVPASSAAAPAPGHPGGAPPASVADRWAPGDASSPRGRAALGWFAAAAAVLVLAVGLTWSIAAWQHGEQNRTQSREIAALAQLAAWQLRIDARDDAQRVLLAAPGAEPDDAVGSLAFSPGSREFVVTATGLEPPGGGREYRCWVVVDGARERLGKMYFAGDIAYWVGRVDVLDRVTPGATFGVSIGDADVPGVVADPVLTGTL